MNEYLRPYIMRRFVIPGVILIVLIVGAIIYVVAPYRASKSPAVEQNTKAPAASCTIKGNIDEKGEHIYHVPGDQWYAKTKVDPSRGERWFCSESEARAAGWRPPVN